jgi:prophage tail gpP-like protein
MISDGNGDLIYTQGSGIKIPGNARLLMRKRKPDQPSYSNSNNIKESNVVYDISQRFYSYIVKSQGNAAALNLTGEVSEETLTDSSNQAVIDNGGPFSLRPVRSSRNTVELADKSSSSTECLEQAKWQADIDRVKSFNYEAVVVGDSIFGTDIPWDYNFLIPVIDEFWDIDNDLLINSVELNQSPTSGTTTKLGMVTPDAYTTELEEPIKILLTGGIGFDLNG